MKKEIKNGIEVLTLEEGERVVVFSKGDVAKFGWKYKFLDRFFKEELRMATGIGYWYAYNQLDSLKKYH